MSATHFCHFKCELADGFRPKTLQDIDQDYFTSTDDPELEFDEDGTELSSTKEGMYCQKIPKYKPFLLSIHIYMQSLYFFKFLLYYIK